MNLANMIRPEVKDFEPYLPGKPIEEVQRELGLKKIIKLASNENAIGASPKAVAALKSSAKLSYRYPEGPGTILRRALAKKLKVEPEEITLGAGSDEIIEILAKAFFKRDDEIIVSKHAFVRYKMSADLLGAKTLEVPMKDNKHDLRAMAERIGPKTKAIFIANPNNPTGTYANASEMEEFVAAYRSLIPDPEMPPFIVVDEAYYEFARAMAKDYPDLLKHFDQGLNLIILRTFSKAFGLAGLRVGYGIARKGIVEVFDRVRPPFNVSTAAQAAGLAALSDLPHLQKSLECVKTGMKYLMKELDKLRVSYLPSAGNFLLINVAPRRGKDVFQKLLEKGVIIRAMDEYGFPGHIRVTVGLREENAFFISKLKELLG